jgi:hypothetical protein
VSKNNSQEGLKHLPDESLLNTIYQNGHVWTMK